MAFKLEDVTPSYFTVGAANWPAEEEFHTALDELRDGKPADLELLLGSNLQPAKG